MSVSSVGCGFLQYPASSPGYSIVPDMSVSSVRCDLLYIRGIYPGIYPSISRGQQACQFWKPITPVPVRSATSARNVHSCLGFKCTLLEITGCRYDGFCTTSIPYPAGSVSSGGRPSIPVPERSVSSLTLSLHTGTLQFFKFHENPNTVPDIPVPYGTQSWTVTHTQRIKVNLREGLVSPSLAGCELATSEFNKPPEKKESEIPQKCE